MTNTFSRRAAAIVGFVGAMGIGTSASAAGLNDPGCKPTPARPNPVVVVHGQGGNFEGMSAVTGALVSAGYCVYAKNYGKPTGGAFGQEHLGTSAAEIGAFIDGIMAQTKAAKIDVVGHSAGVGVLDNYIQKKGGAAKVQHAVMFGGLHHPYAHVGIPKMIDASFYLPNMILAARQVVPGITIQDLAKTAITMYTSAGSPFGMLDPAMVQTATSNFTADLFDPAYWEDLHGTQSEVPGNFVMVGQSVRSRPTNDSAPNVCYTNIVAIADLLAGATAGFQDEAANVDNFLLTSSVTQNAHIDMLNDPAALAKMQAGLSWSCAPGAPKKLMAFSNDSAPPPSAADLEAANEFRNALAGNADGEKDDDVGTRRSPQFADNSGCSAAPRARPGFLGPALAGIAAVVARWRRRVRGSRPTSAARARSSGADG